MAVSRNDLQRVNLLSSYYFFLICPFFLGSNLASHRTPDRSSIKAPRSTNMSNPSSLFRIFIHLKYMKMILFIRAIYVVLVDRGPMVALQYYLGIMRQGQLTPLSLVNQYIKYRQLDEVCPLSLFWSNSNLQSLKFFRYNFSCVKIIHMLNLLFVEFSRSHIFCHQESLSDLPKNDLNDFCSDWTSGGPKMSEIFDY